MKLNFKSLIIVFLVALLGSGIGTFGIMSYYNRNIDSAQSNDVTVSQVEYANVNKTDYTLAIEKAYDTVVEITCTVQSPYSSGYFFFGGSTVSTSAGSGVIFSEDGYIITNEHVIDGLTSEDSLEIKIYTGETYKARVIGYDTRTDLAVLKIDAKNLPYVSFADSSKLLLGQDVIAIGNPLGLGISCSNGIVSALEKEIYVNNVYMTVIQTNAAVNAGNSGGGLFDINGNLVGIVNAKNASSYSSSTSVEGMNYAIPSNTVVRIISDLIEYGYVKDRAALGIKVYTSSSYYSSKGVMISEVIEGGSAQQAGLEKNDVILSINGIEVNSYGELSKVLDTKAIGDVVKVIVQRDDQQLGFDVTLQGAQK